jgi:hypothetical protein
LDDLHLPDRHDMSMFLQAATDRVEQEFTRTDRALLGIFHTITASPAKVD